MVSVSSGPGLKSRFVGANGEQCTVEEFALQHYACEESGGWRGVQDPQAM